MRFKLIIKILFLAISINTYSQIVFNKTYDYDTLFEGFSTQLELTNGGFIVADQASNITNEIYDSYISRIDAFGDVVWEKK
jgi:hypothetical protein